MKTPEAAWMERRRRRPTLGPGSRGHEVEALQQRLARLGFYEGEVDGTYGELTEDAVRSFQRAFRLHADGIAGPELFRLLDDPLLALVDGQVEQFVMGWAESAEEAGRGPTWLSGWAVPFAELRVDRLGRPELRHVDAAPPATPPGGDAGEAPPVPVVTLCPGSGIATPRDGAGPWLARLRRAAPGRVPVASADRPAPPAGRSPPNSHRPARGGSCGACGERACRVG
ncbi:peptidoglycan-binding domain-containing protein [Geochorda subterranea]|uniref:Peptidoglycan-binding protein n=1 Tax=Geochorda subterranea TaxID=3109564 RepID=A0ABZ1BPE3_9FIRM|nr:peptidoglycan-binding protein [Limnochorda sp. LNt]WRP14696.1 peptidoglycan-binding protein [Limnochorda sp. LNt]